MKARLYFIQSEVYLKVIRIHVINFILFLIVIFFLISQVHQLGRELLREKAKVKALSEELENPLNVHRWRKLEVINYQFCFYLVLFLFKIFFFS